MVIRIAGRELVEYTSAEVGRDLADIAGQFRIGYFPRHDMATFGDSSPAPVSRTALAEIYRITEHDPVEILIHGQTVLKGWVDDIQLRMDGGSFEAWITGRDVTGDLVDATANPTGPGEYRMVTLAKLVQTICLPFGFTVAADVDVGTPFTLVALEPAETAMAAIERHSRQRGVLVTSDGVGGVVLTKSGQTRAPDSLRNPGNVHAMEARLSSRGRFSDVYVKGSFNSLLRPVQSPLRAGGAPLDAPLGGSGAGVTPDAAEAAATLRFGHAIDPAVRRYRPRVFLSASQSGGSVEAQQAMNPVDPNSGASTPASGAYRGSVRHVRRKAMKPRTDESAWTMQDQAEWRMRSTRAGAAMRVYSVIGLRAQNGALWLPNQLVLVQDHFAGIDQDMLIGAVTWVAAPDGYRTRLSVVQPDVYDLTGDMDTSHNGLRHTKRARAFDGTASGHTS
jgi:prophage tail gpP-like protein